jgi:hypothetical protein
MSLKIMIYKLVKDMSEVKIMKYLYNIAILQSRRAILLLFLFPMGKIKYYEKIKIIFLLINSE